MESIRSFAAVPQALPACCVRPKSMNAVHRRARTLRRALIWSRRTRVAVHWVTAVYTVKLKSMSVHPIRAPTEVHARTVSVRSHARVSPATPVCAVNTTSTNVHPRRVDTVRPVPIYQIASRATVREVIPVRCVLLTSMNVRRRRVRMVVRARISSIAISASAHTDGSASNVPPDCARPNGVTVTVRVCRPWTVSHFRRATVRVHTSVLAVITFRSLYRRFRRATDLFQSLTKLTSPPHSKCVVYRPIRH